MMYLIVPSRVLRVRVEQFKAVVEVAPHLRYSIVVDQKLNSSLRRYNALGRAALKS